MFLKDKPKWQGVTHRDQDTVIDPSGLCVWQSVRSTQTTHSRLYYGEENNQHRQPQGNTRWLESLFGGGYLPNAHINGLQAQ